MKSTMGVFTATGLIGAMVLAMGLAQGAGTIPNNTLCAWQVDPNTGIGTVTNDPNVLAAAIEQQIMPMVRQLVKEEIAACEQRNYQAFQKALAGQAATERSITNATINAREKALLTMIRTGVETRLGQLGQ